MGKNADDNIAEPGGAGKTAESEAAGEAAGDAEAVELRPGVDPCDMCRPLLRAGEPPHCFTVTLVRSGKYFYCPLCKRYHCHPPVDHEYQRSGYALCDFYLHWFEIEGGEPQRDAGA